MCDIVWVFGRRFCPVIIKEKLIIMCSAAMCNIKYQITVKVNKKLNKHNNNKSNTIIIKAIITKIKIIITRG